MENLQQLIRWMLLKMVHTCPIPIQLKALHGLLEKIFSNCFLISSVCLSLGWDLSSKGSVWFLPFLIVIPNHQIWRPRNTTKDITSPIYPAFSSISGNPARDERPFADMPWCLNHWLGLWIDKDIVKNVLRSLGNHGCPLAVVLAGTHT